MKTLRKAWRRWSDFAESKWGVLFASVLFFIWIAMYLYMAML